MDPKRTRCGFCFHILVQHKWTRTPFSIYNNIGGGGGSPHGRHHAPTTTHTQHCTGCPCFQTGSLVSRMSLKLSSFLSPLAQHPGRQLRGTLFSGPNNLSSRMLFWPRLVVHVLDLVWSDIFGPVFAAVRFLFPGWKEKQNVGVYGF